MRKPLTKIQTVLVSLTVLFGVCWLASKTPVKIDAPDFLQPVTSWWRKVPTFFGQGQATGIAGTPRVQGVVGGDAVAVQDLAGVSTSGPTTLSAACVDASTNACPANSAISIDTSGQFGAWFKLPSSQTLSGVTLKADCSSDGSTWTPTYFDVGDKLLSKTIVTGTIYDLSIVPCQGQRYSRVRLSAYTSGTAQGSMTASIANDPSELFGGNVGSTVQPPVVTQGGGWNGTSLQADWNEANTHSKRVQTMPTDVGTGGSYAACAVTGTMAAGLATNAPVVAFRWGSSTFTALIRRVTVAMASSTTGFTAGNGTYRMIAARSFTVADTGGTAVTLTTNNAKRRTNFATSAVADFRASSTATLTAGTRTMDATPLSIISYGVPATTSNTDLPTTTIWGPDFTGEWPLVLVQNEGFEIQATVPATGTWIGTFCIEWSETPGSTWP